MKSRIEINIELDDSNVPEKLDWSSSDGQISNQEVKAMFLSVFDKDTLDTLKIELWTKEMQVGEMDRFVFQILRGMSDTYMKATNNSDLSNDMRKFVQYFGEKTGIIPLN